MRHPEARPGYRRLNPGNVCRSRKLAFQFAAFESVGTQITVGQQVVKRSPGAPAVQPFAVAVLVDLKEKPRIVRFKSLQVVLYQMRPTQQFAEASISDTIARHAVCENIEPHVEIRSPLRLAWAEVADHAAGGMGQIEERARHQRAARKGLGGFNGGLGWDETIRIRPIKDAVIVKREAAGDSIVITEEGEHSRGRQGFGFRQAAQLCAIDLTDKNKRLRLGHRPLPTRWR